MWNLAEPGSRFGAVAPNHPEALLEEPQAFQAVGEKHPQYPQGFLQAGDGLSATFSHIQSNMAVPAQLMHIKHIPLGQLHRTPCLVATFGVVLSSKAY